jgi:hypothetical protein
MVYIVVFDVWLFWRIWKMMEPYWIRICGVVLLAATVGMMGCERGDGSGGGDRTGGAPAEAERPGGALDEEAGPEVTEGESSGDRQLADADIATAVRAEFLAHEEVALDRLRSSSIVDARKKTLCACDAPLCRQR